MVAIMRMKVSRPSGRSSCSFPRASGAPTSRRSHCSNARTEQLLLMTPRGGTDGIPFRAFHSIFNVTGVVVFAILQFAMHYQNTPTEEFAWARLVLPPKREGRWRDERWIVNVWEARPISIHLTMFRILIAVVAATLSPAVPVMVSKEQVGGMEGCTEHAVWGDAGVMHGLKHALPSGHLPTDFRSALHGFATSSPKRY